MQPDTTPFREAPPATNCTDCGDQLPTGRRLRCDLCVQAAELAIEELPGQVVRPSDVARIRARPYRGP